MTKEQQRIAIFKACGGRIEVSEIGTFVYQPNKKVGSGFRFKDETRKEIIALLPNYPADLNAMHEAKRQLLTTFDLCNTFQNYLLEERLHPAPYETDKWIWGQSAEIEAIALLRALNLWKP